MIAVAVEREIKTVLTLEDASFRKGLKAAASSVSAARAEMQASVASASGLTKGLKQFGAQATGLSKILKAEREQLRVLSKEYDTQKKKLTQAAKAVSDAQKKQARTNEEVKKAAKAYKTATTNETEAYKELQKLTEAQKENAKELQSANNVYAVASASVDDMRVKMANLNTQIAKDKNDLQSLVTGPLKSFAKVAAGAIAAAGAALIKFTQDSNNAEMTLKQNLTATETQFGVWSKFLEQEAASAWKNMGLSKSRYLALANEIGGYILENGAPLEDAAQASAEALELASQLSEEYGVPIEEVWEDIKAAADGSRTALQRYGIQLTGLTANTQSANYQMTDEEKKLQALKEILEGNYKPLLNFRNKTDEIKNSQKNLTESTNKLTAAWDNFLSGSGSASDVGQAAAQLAVAWAENLAEKAGVMISAIGPFFSAFADELWARVTAGIPQWLTDIINTLFPDKNTKPGKADANGERTGGHKPEIHREVAFGPTAQEVAQDESFIHKVGEYMMEKAKTEKAVSQFFEDRGYGFLAGLYGKNAEINELVGAFWAGRLRKAPEKPSQEMINLFGKYWSEEIEAVVRSGMPGAAHLLAQDLTLEAQPYSQSDEENKDSSQDFAENAEATIEAQEQINNALDILGGQVSESSEKINESFAEIIDTADGLSSALSEAAKNLYYMGTGGGGINMPMKKAGGAWDVPFDDYVAALHKGEMVLTADQARRYRAQAARGGNTYNESANIYIDKYNQYSGEDANALLLQMQVMQRRQRMGYGLV